MKTSTVKLIDTTARKCVAICDEHFEPQAIASIKAELVEFLSEAMENETPVHVSAPKEINAPATEGE